MKDVAGVARTICRPDRAWALLLHPGATIIPFPFENFEVYLGTNLLTHKGKIGRKITTHICPYPVRANSKTRLNVCLGMSR